MVVTGGSLREGYSRSHYYRITAITIIRDSMRKVTINTIVDIIMFIAFIPTLLSGVVLFWVLPEGGRFSGHAVFMGLSRHIWTTMHDWWGIIFSIIVILHLLLHWRFFRVLPSCFRKRREEEDAE